MPTGTFRGLATREFLFAGSPTSTLYENFPHDFINADNAIAATGIMTSVAVPLLAGDTITKISFFVGATAGATLTHQFVALYSNAATPALLAQSTDAAAASMAANTAFTGTLQTAQVISVSGLYWAAIVVVGTTIPTLVGKTTAVNATVAAAINAAPTIAFPGVCVSSGSALTATAPPTIATPTILGVQPYVLLQ